ncbi:LOW QUALITY PROTEIN: hypothetical protein PoB_002615300 [Plakobranchus ocellatus]|uniref:Uncharacterized protein n=1 Tax=Plakobranchus ocellatus TaxID=259542 RepID=A0AAV3ZXQ4_9GAST|nr:LOW QUALITY PROTEIN: hypothetical protein PoB_002615300 [Plakobranchus ocellatus]
MYHYGSFHHDDTEWNLEPLTALSSVAGRQKRATHKVFPAFINTESISFVGDEVVDDQHPAAPVEILTLANRNRHRMATLNGMLGQQKNGIQQAVSNGKLAFVVDYADYENVTCTLTRYTGSDDKLPAPTGNDRAGLVQSRDEQCRRFFHSSSSSYCRFEESDYWDEDFLCGGMYCSIPWWPVVCFPLLPLEYTTCGTGKVFSKLEKAKGEKKNI